MASLIDSIDGIKTIEDGLVANKVAKFSYTQCAYDTNDVNGVSEYNYQCEQNIPLPDASTLKVNETTLNKGYRSQASSITRMLLNHFFGRVSYNLNKLNDNFSSLLTALKAYIGRANGVASLDENGRIPYSQLPETAQELKGTWNASTNVWTGYDGATGSLISGTGDIGDTYIVTTEGWFDSATGQSSSTPVAGYEHYLVNGRIMYNGTDWVNISGSSHYALCNESYFRAGEGSSASSYSVVIGSNACSISSYGVGIGAFARVNCGVAIGRQAMTDKGVSIGTCALGSSGVAIGIETNAGTGVAIGCKATSNDGISIGYNTCSGTQSVAIGANAGSYASAGCNNVFIGNNTAQGIAGDSSENVVIGKNAMCLSCNCTVYRTVIIGSNAGVRNRANNNVFVGQGSGYNNTTGGGNVFLGLDSGVCNTTGSNNVFLGQDSGFNNTTGSDNTFLGQESGSTNTTGESNTFVGLSSGKCNTTGSYNTFMGESAGSQNRTGCHNAFFGDVAGCKNITGSSNTFIGSYAGYNNVDGSGNTFIGRYAGLSATTNNAVIIGNISSIENVGFAIGHEDTGGTNNNYLFTCKSHLYWCHGSTLVTLA